MTKVVLEEEKIKDFNNDNVLLVDLSDKGEKSGRTYSIIDNRKICAGIIVSGFALVALVITGYVLAEALGCASIPPSEHKKFVAPSYCKTKSFSQLSRKEQSKCREHEGPADGRTVCLTLVGGLGGVGVLMLIVCYVISSIGLCSAHFSRRKDVVDEESGSSLPQMEQSNPPNDLD